MTIHPTVDRNFPSSFVRYFSCLTSRRQNRRRTSSEFFATLSRFGSPVDLSGPLHDDFFASMAARSLCSPTVSENEHTEKMMIMSLAGA